MNAPTEIQEQVPVHEEIRQGESSSFFLSSRLENILRYSLLVPCLLYAYAIFQSLAYMNLFPFTIPKEVKPEALCGTAVLGAWMLLIAHFTLVRNYGMAFLLSFLGLMLSAIRLGKTADPVTWIPLILITGCAYLLMCTRTYRRRLERERNDSSGD
ncbi:MAG TPA: hypothetical protein PLA90_16905 [Candidatus Sumerlaeota bacterium]|nr:hypothetical protein [Candidatus Sumerlaeota bacterium]HPS03220.1 hypothetical protein [Candidatus Sumerlaeota bacterium]